MNARTGSKTWAAIAGIALPLLLIAVWHALNRTYPRGDEGYYFSHAQRVFQEFQVGGFFHGLGAIYTERLDKPVISPYLALPALWLFRGNVAFSIALTETVLFAGFLLYAFLLGCEFLPLASAALLTTTIGTAPWLIHNAYAYDMEMPLLLCVAGTLYHLRKSNWFSDRRQSGFAGAWLGASFCVRPIEAALFFIPSIIVMGIVAFRQIRVSRRELLGCACVLAVGIGLLVKAIHGDPSGQLSVSSTLPYIAALGCAVVLNMFMTRARGKPISAFVIAFSMTFGIATIWAVPTMGWLYKWAYLDSFGVPAIAGRTRAGQLLFMGDTIRRLGAALLPCVVPALMAAGATRAIRPPRRSQAAFIACIALMIFVPPVIGSFSHNIDQRYYYSSGFVLLLTLGACVARFLLPLLLVPIFFQTYFIASQTFALPWIPLPEQASKAFYLDWPIFAPWPPVVHRTEPTRTLISEIQQAASHDTKLVAVIFPEDLSNSWLMNPDVWRVAQNEMNLNFHFLVFRLNPVATPDAMLDQMRDEFARGSFQYAVIGNNLYSRLKSSGRLGRDLRLSRVLDGEEYGGKSHPYFLITGGNCPL